jgi:hypothetical protein
MSAATPSGSGVATEFASQLTTAEHGINAPAVADVRFWEGSVEVHQRANAELCVTERLLICGWERVVTARISAIQKMRSCIATSKRYKPPGTNLRLHAQDRAHLVPDVLSRINPNGKCGQPASNTCQTARLPPRRSTNLAALLFDFGIALLRDRKKSVLAWQFLTICWRRESIALDFSQVSAG